MALLCKLNRNISLVQPSDSGGTDGCNGQSLAEGVGGIAKVVVYNISDVPSLTFENDNRADESLVVDTINSIGQFYTIDFSSATYQEDYDTANHKWTHTLTLEIPNIATLIEDILADGVNGKYLVCFLPKGSEDWRCFGWRWGATLDYSLNISEDSHSYTVTLDDVSEYPLFAVDKDNFGSKTKVYTPIFKPLYDIFFCEQDGSGRHTGYMIAMYVVKVNAAGQPLDKNNRLCQWSGYKQDAYKYVGIQSDGGYNIIGTYNKDATFDGKPVKVYDLEKCPANVTNSIFINSKKAEAISLNSTISAGTFTITSTDDWTMVSDPRYVTIEPVEGENGNTQCSLHHNGVGGCEQIQFQNKVSREIVTLDVCVNIIQIEPEYTYPKGTTDAIITPIVEGCDSAYTYTITPSVTHTKDAEGNIHITFPDVTSDLEYTLTTVHGCDSNERKVTKIYRKGIGTDPNWVLQQSYCELDGSGNYTGFRIDYYLDFNPDSSTYKNGKYEKVLDSTCSEGSPSWGVESEYCETDGSGKKTGYYVTVLRDNNPKSPTYQEERITKTLDTSSCPVTPDDPQWIPDPNFDPYCETKIYEPSMLEGNTGKFIFQIIDDNSYSSSFGQTQMSAVTESEWTSDFEELYGDFPCEVPDTDPDVEEISYSCELSADTEENLVMTGYKLVVGMDKNPYSSTYLETTTVRELDVVACPPNHPEPPTPPEPSGCTAFIVDGGEWNNAPASGDNTCDSAFLFHEGTPILEPANAADWVTIQMYHWDTDDKSTMCSWYDAYPCVAHRLMIQAEIPEAGTEAVECDGAYNPPLTAYPQVVQDAVNKTGKYAHALGSLKYFIAPNTGSTRSCTIKWIVDSEECPSREFKITQLGGDVPPTPTTRVFTFGDGTTYKSPMVESGSGVYEVAMISTVDGTPTGYTVSETCNWINNSYTATPTSFKFSYSQNTESSSRTCRITLIQQGTYATCVLEVTQNAAGQGGESFIRWNIANHYQSYTASTPWNQGIRLETFSSLLNGVSTNAVISSNSYWIVTDSELYYNRNEFRPNVNGQVVQVQNNTTSQPRTAVITFTQKGSSDRIQLYLTQGAYEPNCTITAFTLDSEACKGNRLNYSFGLADTSCTSEFTFRFFDHNGNMFTSNATPSGGQGTGYFDTSSMAIGTGSCDVTVSTIQQRYTANIKDCTPQTCSCDFWITNQTTDTIYLSDVDFVGQTSVSIGNVTIAPNAQVKLNNKSFDCTYDMKTFTDIMVRDTVVTHRGYTTDYGSGHIEDGYNYVFNVINPLATLTNANTDDESDVPEENGE